MYYSNIPLDVTEKKNGKRVKYTVLSKKKSKSVIYHNRV